MIFRKFKNDIPLALFAVVFFLLYGLVCSSQLLGFINQFKPLPAFIAAICITGGCLYAYFSRANRPFLDSLRSPKDNIPSTGLDVVLAVCGIAILVLIVLIPLILYPYSPVSETLHWDAAAYHFPKAIELFRSGSSWQMHIAYAEYPSGYESLLSFALLITRDETLFGTVHALIALFLFLTLWLLARRYTRLPGGLLAFAISLLMIGGRVLVANNPYWIFTDLIYMIGKNDLFLGVTLLALILHAPFGQREDKPAYSLFGMAAASMLAMSIKPNSVFVVAPIWFYMIFILWKSTSSGTTTSKFPWKALLGCGMVMLPGVLWAIRNLIALHAIFAASTYDLQHWSIANNLTNPNFYNFIPKIFIFITVILVVMLASSAIFKRPRGSLSLLLALLFVGFICTPESGFYGGTDLPTTVAWRFAIALLGFSFVLLFTLFEKWITWLLHNLSQQWVIHIAACLVVCACSAWLLWNSHDLLTVNPKNKIVLEDQFRDSVGGGTGYHSAYDYVQQNIHGAVIHVENGLPYYLYGPGYTNFPNWITKPAMGTEPPETISPEYYVIFKTVWWGVGEGSYPDSLSTQAWNATWKLIYQDTEGRVYQRR